MTQQRIKEVVYNIKLIEQITSMSTSNSNNTITRK